MNDYLDHTNAELPIYTYEIYLPSHVFLDSEK